MKESHTLNRLDVPTGLNLLSELQQRELPLSGDPMLNYCLELEARIRWQSKEIEALRQMLQSEHERHLQAEKRVSAFEWLRSWLRNPRR